MTKLRACAVISVLICTIFSGCRVGQHLSGFFHQAIEDPDIIVGKWQSQDGKEYIEITKGNIIEHEKYTDHHYKVHAKGCLIFTHELRNHNPDKKRIEAIGSIVYGVYNNPRANTSTFIIKWEEMEECEDSTFGLFEDSKLALYFYMTDPDFSDSMLKLYKVND